MGFSVIEYRIEEERKEEGCSRTKRDRLISGKGGRKEGGKEGRSEEWHIGQWTSKGAVQYECAVVESRRIQ